MVAVRPATMAVCLLLTGGCAQDLPRTLQLDSAFTDLEVSAIRESIAEWNDVCQTRLANPSLCLIEGPRFSGGFSPAAFSDGRHVVYKLETRDEGGKAADGPLDDETTGYGTLEEVLLRTFAYTFLNLNQSRCGSRPGDWPWPESVSSNQTAGTLGPLRPLAVENTGRCHPVDQADYGEWLRHLALHELGHFLGLMHFEHRPGVMNKEDDGSYTEHLTDADIEQFCQVYECR